MNSDLFVDSQFSRSTDDKEVGGEANVFLLTLLAQIHCHPKALKEFLKKGPAIKSKKDKAVKSGDGEVYDMAYRLSIRLARYKVLQEHSWTDGTAIDSLGFDAEFVLVAASKDDETVAVAPESLFGGAGLKQHHKRDVMKSVVKGAVKGVVKGAIEGAIRKGKVAEDVTEAGVLHAEEVALTSVTELLTAPHGTTEVRVTCRLEGATINEKDAKEGR